MVGIVKNLLYISYELFFDCVKCKLGLRNRPKHLLLNDQLSHINHERKKELFMPKRQSSGLEVNLTMKCQSVVAAIVVVVVAINSKSTGKRETYRHKSMVTPQGQLKMNEDNEKQGQRERKAFPAYKLNRSFLVLSERTGFILYFLSRIYQIDKNGLRLVYTREI